MPTVRSLRNRGSDERRIFVYRLAWKEVLAKSEDLRQQSMETTSCRSTYVDPVTPLGHKLTDSLRGAVATFGICVQMLKTLLPYRRRRDN